MEQSFKTESLYHLQDRPISSKELKNFPKLVNRWMNEMEIKAQKNSSPLETEASVANIFNFSDKELKKGGIDFNPDNLNIETQGQGIDYNAPIDPQLLESLTSSPIEGFSPIIFNITPILNLPQFLGLNNSEPPVETAQDEKPNIMSFMDDRRNKFFRKSKNMIVT